MRYATPQAFERALSDRLKRQAAEEGADLDRLRKRVAFERFLARVAYAVGFERDSVPEQNQIHPSLLVFRDSQYHRVTL